jgi:hypothetical protein
MNPFGISFDVEVKKRLKFVSDDQDISLFYY